MKRNTKPYLKNWLSLYMASQFIRQILGGRRASAAVILQRNSLIGYAYAARFKDVARCLSRIVMAKACTCFFIVSVLSAGIVYARDAADETFQAWQDNIEMSGGIGLVMKLRLDDNKMPALYVHAAPYFSGQPRPFWAVDGIKKLVPGPEFGFGLVAPDVSLDMELADMEGDWSYRRYSWLTGPDPTFGEEQTFNVTVSRLAPGALVECTGDQLAMFCGPAGRMPRYFACRKPGGAAATVAIDRDADEWEHRLGGNKNSWSLFWGFDPVKAENLYGADLDGAIVRGERDSPLLMIHDSPPASLTATQGDGLLLQFPDAGYRVMIVPLSGLAHPLHSEIANWSSALPDDIARRCDETAALFSHYPISVREAYEYDSDNDIVRITEHVRYIELLENGTRHAPLPPMAALAEHYGFPVGIVAGGQSVPVKDTGILSAYGPYCVVENTDSYAICVKGMGKYAFERRQVMENGAPSNARREMVQEWLEKEISTALDAGHLAPVNIPLKNASYGGWKEIEEDGGRAWGSWSHPTLRLLYSNPAQTINTLCAALPFLGPEIRERTMKYIIAEREAFPPETTAHISGKQGARREAWDMPAENIAMLDFSREANFHVIRNLVPAENAYALAEYYAAAGKERFLRDNADNAVIKSVKSLLSPYIERGEWASCGWRGWDIMETVGDKLYGCNRTADANRMIAGLIGLTRLATLAGDSEGAHQAMALLGRALMHRYAIGRYAEYMYELGILSMPEGASPLQDIRPLMVTEEGVNLAMLSDYSWGGGDSVYMGPYMDTVPELGRFMFDFLRPQAEAYIGEIAMLWSDWYMRFGGMSGSWAETYCNYPTDARQIFNVRAWALGQSGDELLEYIDCPLALRGDWFFAEKLAETLRAYNGTKWE